MRGKNVHAFGFLPSPLSQLLISSIQSSIQSLNPELYLQSTTTSWQPPVRVLVASARSASATTERCTDRCRLPASGRHDCRRSLVALPVHYWSASPESQSIRRAALPAGARAPMRAGRFAARQSFRRATRISWRSQIGSSHLYPARGLGAESASTPERDPYRGALCSDS